jgi:hypothetical protein
MAAPLHKTTIVIWTEFEPTSMELEDLAREASVGDAYCSSSVSEYVEHPETDPAWDGTEFFDRPDGGKA